LLKYDSIGNPIWAKGFGSSGIDGARSIITDTTGNIYMTGHFSGFKFIAGNDTLYQTDTSWDNSTSDMFILKLDINGNIIWAKSTNGDEGAFPASIALDKHDNIYISGTFFSDILIFGNDTLFNASHSYPNEPDVFIVKYDNNGNVKWAKQAGGIELDEGNCIITDDNNNIFIGGVFDNSYIVFGNDTLFNYNSNVGDDLFIVRYDTIGNVIWTKSAGGNRNDNVTCITIDNSGNICIAGYFDSPSLRFGNILLNNSLQDWTDDIFVAKLSSNTGIFENNVQVGIKIYPNPTTDNITIAITDKALPCRQAGTIEISNISGQLIKTIYCNGKETTVDVGDLASGVYIIKVKTDKGVVVRKFIKE
jgi:hypothetical protein